MSKYEGLLELYIGAKEANDQYWFELRQMISRIRTAFSAYIGAGDDLINVGNTQRPVVAIGRLAEDSTFKAWAVDSLPKRGAIIEFALCISFPYAADAEPQPEFVYGLSIARSSEGFLVSRPGYVDEPFLGPPFTELFDHLVSSTEMSIKESRRL